MAEKLYQATFYCSLLISATSQREATAKVKEMAQRNHLKIESGASERLQVYRHRPNGMLKRGPRYSPIKKRLKGLLEFNEASQ
jgi:hypothetical protein